MKYFEKYNVEMNEETMILKITKDSPRSRMGYKMVVNYRFRTVEQMKNYFETEWFAPMFKMQSQIAEQKAKKAEARANFVNPYKVGQIFYDSWGYDQTNIDFFQVTEVGKKSVKIRKIGQKMTKADGYLCEYVVADPSQFIGEEMTKVVTFDRSGKSHIVSPFRGWLHEWDGREKYQSHYA